MSAPTSTAPPVGTTSVPLGVNPVIGTNNTVLVDRSPSPVSRPRNPGQVPQPLSTQTRGANQFVNTNRPGVSNLLGNPSQNNNNTNNSNAARLVKNLNQNSPNLRFIRTDSDSSGEDDSDRRPSNSRSQERRGNKQQPSMFSNSNSQDKSSKKPKRSAQDIATTILFQDFSRHNFEDLPDTEPVPSKGPLKLPGFEQLVPRKGQK